MTHYRIYALGKSGHVLRGFDAECADDAAAKAFAFAGMGRGESREVWKDTRCIGFFIGPRGSGAIASRVTPAPDHGAGAGADAIGMPLKEGSPPPSDLAI
jgi:hypothetical protein